MEIEMVAIMKAIAPDGEPVDAEELLRALVLEGLDLFTLRTAMMALVEKQAIELHRAGGPRTMLRLTPPDQVQSER